MSIFTGTENRKHVRTPILVPVNFSVMSTEEYKKLAACEGRDRSSAGRRGMDERMTSALNNAPFCTKCEPYLIDFLFRIDEKLDRILELTAKDKDDRIKKGETLNISGSGMSILCNEELATGDIIKADFLVSRIPPIWLDLYGKIVRVDPNRNAGAPGHEISVIFIDLSEEDREQIIAYTFRRQRESIRSMKES